MEIVDQLFIYREGTGLFVILRAFSSSDKNDVPTNDEKNKNKIFRNNEDTISWSFGRHPEYCDVVLDNPYVTAIHFVILMDRSLNLFFGHDGGYYPKQLIDRKTKEVYREPGYDRSTAGTYVNGQPLHDDETTDLLVPKIKPLYEGDRIYVAGARIKLLVSKNPNLKNIDWGGVWMERSNNGAIVPSKKQQEELMKHQERKIEYDPSSWGTLQKFMDWMFDLPPYQFIFVFLFSALLSAASLIAIAVIILR